MMTDTTEQAAADAAAAAAGAADDQPKGLVTIKHRAADGALDEAWILQADWRLGHEEFASEDAALARKAELEPQFAAWLEAQLPEPEPERTPCAVLDELTAKAKFRKLLARGGVLVASDDAHQIDEFAPVPFQLRDLEEEPGGAHLFLGTFKVSTIGSPRGMDISGFAIKAAKNGDARGDVLAFCEVPGGLRLAPGQEAEFRGRTLVFMTDASAK